MIIIMQIRHRVSMDSSKGRQGERSEQTHRRRMGNGDAHSVWLGTGDVNNAFSGNKGPQSIALWEGSCCVYEKKGRPQADKASEASKPTVIVSEKGDVYNVSSWKGEDE